jgi:hypothetical protein
MSEVYFSARFRETFLRAEDSLVTAMKSLAVEITLEGVSLLASLGVCVGTILVGCSSS